MSSKSHTRCARRAQRGFTLVELVSVMAIAIMMMGLASAGYLGYIRSSSINRGVGMVRSKIMLARQHAATKKQLVYVIPGGTYLRIYVAIGRKNDSASITHFVSDGWIPKLEEGAPIYHPGLDATGIVETCVHLPETQPPTYQIVATPNWAWFENEVCAMLLDEFELPRGTKFSTSTGGRLTVNPTGTVETGNGSDMVLEVVEEVGPMSAKVTVKNISGAIILDETYAY